MEVKIKSIHFDATDRLRDFIIKKVDKLSKHNEEIAVSEVTLKVIKPETAMNKEASVRLLMPQREELFASKVADTFEEAVDNCVDALKRQLEKAHREPPRRGPEGHGPHPMR